MNIGELWISKNEEDWVKYLNRYWDLIKPENLELEKRMDKLDFRVVENMELDEFYEFIIEDYFQWKFTDSRWLNRNREHFSRYKNEKKLDELSEIKDELFSFNLNDIERGLRITSSIHGLGVAGGSGLLAILFPAYFATVDQFVVKSLASLDEYKDNIDLMNMKIKVDKGQSLNFQDGVILIEIMRRKALEINRLFNSNKWTCRDIDKILWRHRDSKDTKIRSTHSYQIGSNENNQNRSTNHYQKNELENIKTDYKFNFCEEECIDSLKTKFEIYLRNKGRKEDRIKEDLSWAFIHRTHNIGIEFWESFKSDEQMSECREALYRVAVNGGFRGRGVKDPRGYAAGYMTSIKKLKNFFDEEYGGVDNYLKIYNNL